jgi:hypothetical protein
MALPVVPASVLLALAAIPAVPPHSASQSKEQLHQTSGVAPMEVVKEGDSGGGGGGGGERQEGKTYEQLEAVYRRMFIEGLESEDQLLWMESMAYEAGRSLRLGNRLQQLYSFQLFLVKKQIIQLDLSNISAAIKRKEQLSLELKALEGRVNRDAEVRQTHKRKELKIFQGLPLEGSLSQIAETTVTMEWTHQQWVEGRIREAEADLAKNGHTPPPVDQLARQRLKAKVRKAEEEERQAKASADAVQLQLEEMRRLRKAAADAIDRRSAHERRKAQAQAEIDRMMCD